MPEGISKLKATRTCMPRLQRLTVAILVGLSTTPFAAAQGFTSSQSIRDPGVRDGAPAAGGALPNLTGQQLALFNAGLAAFNEVDSVSGTIPGEADAGLGPSFNLNSCGGCHNFPAAGGSSPRINPQIAVATLHGARNTVPSFLSIDGPVREARFKRNADGTPDGGVHNLFVTTGRSDAGGCRMQQTDFATQVARNNVVFRIPTPTFGNGLIEAIPDATILANMAADSKLKAQFGIRGHENRTGNDGSVTRFGWKAQNKSLLIFAGEAYAVEQGVTNEVFPSARETDPSCEVNGHPEDQTNFVSGGIGDATLFALFMRFLAPPQSVRSYNNVSADSIQRGRGFFNAAGCALCHTASLQTGRSSVAAMSNQPVPLYSDLLVHNMGSGLADGISQGSATGEEFRTAPLWGLGQRIFFLHDGRTKDLVEAVRAHFSPGSEANGSVTAINALSDANKQDVLNFLRSL